MHSSRAILQALPLLSFTFMHCRYATHSRMGRDMKSAVNFYIFCIFFFIYLFFLTQGGPTSCTSPQA